MPFHTHCVCFPGRARRRRAGDERSRTRQSVESISEQALALVGSEHESSEDCRMLVADTFPGVLSTLGDAANDQDRMVRAILAFAVLGRNFYGSVYGPLHF